MMDFIYNPLSSKEIDKLLSWGEPKKRTRTRPFRPERLKEVISKVKRGAPIDEFPKSFHKVIWELMKCQTHITKLEQRIEKIEAK